MVFALGLGLLASLAFFISGNVYAYAASFIAGLLAAWLVDDRNRGLGGLVLGIVAAYVVYGAYAVAQQIDACGDNCGGLSSPNLTAVIVVVFGLIGLCIAVAGFVGTRVVRRLATGRAQEPV
ncbi:MAG TPA: hypothetical protein VFU17_09850 [Candidatus Limnocylindrales bacterium]|nr:hypothetical protein [Candidatus Limnocylindrales bacterium]